MRNKAPSDRGRVEKQSNERHGGAKRGTRGIYAKAEIKADEEIEEIGLIICRKEELK